MEILALIPARGGSKEIPGKNIIPLAGKPLLAYTAEAVLGSNLVTRTILSTDDAKIADIGRGCGLEVPFMRPAELAQDTTPAIDVIRHVVTELEAREGYVPDGVVWLQPTSPFRRSQHIDEALTLFIKNPDVATVVSILEVPHQFNPHSIVQKDAQGVLTSFMPQNTTPLRRQDKPQLWARNGPAILAVRTEWLKTGQGFYEGKTLGYVMDATSSLDIDTPWDLRLAEWISHNDTHS